MDYLAKLETKVAQRDEQMQAQVREGERGSQREREERRAGFPPLPATRHPLGKEIHELEDLNPNPNPRQGNT